MCEGEFESLKAIHAISPRFVPRPYAWGKYSQETPETYFLLAEFRDVGEQVCGHKFLIICLVFENERPNLISIIGILLAVALEHQ